MDTLTEQQRKVGEKWSKEIRPERTRFWQSDQIRRHINRGLGVESPRTTAGFHYQLSKLGQFDRAVSVGCGTATKEIGLLSSGVVGHFDCYELSEARIRVAQQLAKDKGVPERISFHQTDAFSQELSGHFDLVYWNSALHHMMDVEIALSWSADRLRIGGVFAMSDFVGPTGFQWTDVHLHYVNSYRSRLPDHMFRNHKRPSRPFPRAIVRVDREKLWAKDPSEAADSGRILETLPEVFPNVQVWRTGGAIYHTALNDVLTNIEEGSEWIEEALALDDFMREIGTSLHAIALARKG